MTKIDLTPIEEVQRNLIAENARLWELVRILESDQARADEELAKVREVNAEQANQIERLRDEVNRLDDTIAMLVEQSRRASVRAERAEDECEKVREVAEAQANALKRLLAESNGENEHLREQIRQAQQRARVARSGE